MKTKILAAVTAIFAGNAAVAGTLVEPVMEVEVIQEEASASSGGYLVPLVMLGLLALLVSGGSSGTPSPQPE